MMCTCPRLKPEMLPNHWVCNPGERQWNLLTNVPDWEIGIICLAIRKCGQIPAKTAVQCCVAQCSVHLTEQCSAVLYTTINSSAVI